MLHHIYHDSNRRRPVVTAPPSLLLSFSSAPLAAARGVACELWVLAIWVWLMGFSPDYSCSLRFSFIIQTVIDGWGYPCWCLMFWLDARFVAAVSEFRYSHSPPLQPPTLCLDPPGSRLGFWDERFQNSAIVILPLYTCY